jgi:lipopolysaccharide/colanic/teichoic acid biosynthesis glycosyltransferase
VFRGHHRKVRLSPLLTFSATPHDEIRLLVKRATDILVAAATLILLSPFTLLIAPLVRVTSPGSRSANSLRTQRAAVCVFQGSIDG